MYVHVRTVNTLLPEASFLNDAVLALAVSYQASILEKFCIPDDHRDRLFRGTDSDPNGVGRESSHWAARDGGLFGLLACLAGQARSGLW